MMYPKRRMISNPNVGRSMLVSRSPGEYESMKSRRRRHHFFGYCIELVENGLFGTAKDGTRQMQKSINTWG